MTQLSVNINKIATLRNSRGKNNPDVLQTARDIIEFGAQGITVHPRPDERHIRKQDVLDLAGAISVELNIEGYPTPEFLDLIHRVRPAQCTLVPDPPHVLTSNAGWQIAHQRDFLKEIVAALHALNVRTSLFIDPFAFDANDAKALADIAPHRIELYTERYAETFGSKDAISVLSRYQAVAKEVTALGIALNAGHDLNLANLKHFVSAIGNIAEVSIGHALICDALYLGLRETIARYRAELNSPV